MMTIGLIVRVMVLAVLVIGPIDVTASITIV